MTHPLIPGFCEIWENERWNLNRKGRFLRWFGGVLRGLDLVWESATPPTHIWERYPKKKVFFYTFPNINIEKDQATKVNSSGTSLIVWSLLVSAIWICVILSFWHLWLYFVFIDYSHLSGLGVLICPPNCETVKLQSAPGRCELWIKSIEILARDELPAGGFC